MKTMTAEENDLEGIKPLNVSPETVWKQNVRDNQIGDAESGANPDVMADIGFKPPKKLGDSALNVVDLEDYPDDIEVHDPSDETVKFWPEEFKYQYTSDGTRWLCAIDSNGKVFAKVKATSDVDANNTAMLLEVTQPILNRFRDIKGQQSLGLEEPKDIAA